MFRNDMEFENHLKSKYDKGGITLLINELSTLFDKNNIVKGKIIEKYIKKIIREYKEACYTGNPYPKQSLFINGIYPQCINQEFSYFDRAIIMTYMKYDSLFAQGQTNFSGLEMTKNCILNAIDNNDVRFTRDCDSQGFSARQYVNSYIQSMYNAVGTNWRSEVYAQIIADSAVEFANQFEIDKSKPVRVKRFFTDNLLKAKSIIKSGIANGISHSQGGACGMYYCQDVGKERSNQEDALLIMEHPSIKNLRLAIVSDGMGGFENGEEASHIVVSEMKNWFKNRPFSSNTINTQELYAELQSVITNISARVYREYGGKSGATLTGTIIGDNKAIVMNVGDSRTYMVKDGALRQVTIDHSNAHNDYMSLFRNLYPGMSEDEMRFYMYSNLITRYIGSPDMDSCRPDFFELDTRDFDQLVLCSDGVSDCLGNHGIATCVRTSDAKKLAQKLVDCATTTLSINPIKAVGFYDKINAGKDNATAVVVDK